MNPYTSIKENATVTLEEKKSKFIGSSFQIVTEDDAKAIIESVRKTHSTATHNCYGFITLDGTIKRFSDDGEPQKTAGLPILDVIDKNKLVGVLIVVTRYFGGTLLGTGGLVKMYQQSAIEAIALSGTKVFLPHSIYEITIPYNLKSKVDNIFERENFIIIKEDYTDVIKLNVEIENSLKDKLFDEVTSLTNGKEIPILIEDNIMK